MINSQECLAVFETFNLERGLLELERGNWKSLDDIDAMYLQLVEDRKNALCRILAPKQ
ncbi:MAG: hypothetical protein ACD_2C00181G0010 [uncultured bacterium (gcode 4)]|uniref:Uncharacterized protein n=1 Tax=uncultured bacterium (gcode 4) TaxID=1234023 RepID=K2G515_9BACT|nr:MAG: hypothetical protein ACD_2C00181G0010 [uncultured bacterium (gcode 4)]